MWKLMIKFPNGIWTEWTDNGINAHQKEAYLLFKKSDEFKTKSSNGLKIEIPHAISGTFKAVFNRGDREVTYRNENGVTVAMKTRYVGSLGHWIRQSGLDLTEEDRDMA